MKWRTRITLLGAVVLVVVLAALPLNMAGATAAPLLQIPPTPTPAPPTNTNTPAPPNTPTPVTPADTPTPVTPADTPTPVPPGSTPTPVPPPHTPRPGGGGGVPPGPSGTPVVNGCVKSIGRNGISLGTEPGFYQPHVQIIPRDQLALVLAGPARVDNIWWWQLQAQSGAVGWGNQDEMTPDPGPCGNGVAPGQTVPPYPVTIVPAFSLEQTAAAPQTSVPTAQLMSPTPQATATSQAALPQTGSSLDLWWLAGLLAVTVIVVGFARRRLHAQPITRGTDSDETTHTQL